MQLRLLRPLPLLCLVSVFTLLTWGCAASATLHATATVEPVGVGQYMITMCLREGDRVLCTPKLIVAADEQAQVLLEDATETIDVRVHAPGASPEAEIDVLWTRSGRREATSRFSVPVGPATAAKQAVD